MVSTSSHVRRRVRTHLDGFVPESTTTGVDTQRLHAAMRILQSELELAGQRLSLADHTDLLTKLYAAIGPGGVQVDTDAMLAFNRQLAERIGRSAT